MKKEIGRAAKVVEEMIAEKTGFPACINVKLRDFERGDDRMSFYKQRSQIRSEPTIIINKNVTGLMVMREIPIDKLDIVLEDEIMRQFTHAIFEYGIVRNAGVKSEIERNFETFDDFKEGFVKYMRTGINSSSYDPVMQSYGKALEELYSFDSTCKIGLS